ncbi:hypothetical protein LPJ53_001925 [Coemansia erecta]|uniref:TPR-like protein n=1 Tax=Coemansia erecta TaxID=147472 RepID=A0A9W7Y393_9FUNG|nr:hypothetical protein LPJ53_001925 [Coemansia erecta]
MHRRSFFSFRRLAAADNSLRTPLVVAAAALVASTLGFVGYAMFFGPGSQYPPSVRSLLREGGMAYLRPENKQDLPKAVEKYTEALRLLDEIGASDPKHAPDAPHVTGLVARIASVYTDMGDIDSTIRMYTDLLHRILGESGMEDPRTQVRLLMDPELDGGRRQNILRALGCANKLAETYEARAARSKRRSVLLADPDMHSSDVQAASRWYQWCLQVVMLTYQNHFNHQMLEQGKPLASTPSFDPSTLPRFFSVDVVTSLFYNAATFFSGHAQYQYAVPLLQRALDLLRPGADSGKEECVCRSSTLMSHLANAAVETSDLPVAEKWAIDGLALAKKFPRNADCLGSFVALTYDLGVVYEAAGKVDSARVQYRQAAEVASVTGDTGAQELAATALDRMK